MGVPDYQTLMLPLLTGVASAGGPVRVREVVDRLADQFALTEDERNARLPSGQENLLVNRVNWARTYLVKAGLLEAPKRGFVCITAEGRTVLAENPERIDNKLLRRFSSFLDWTNPAERTGLSVGELSPEQPAVMSSEVATPRERIDLAISEMDSALKSDLLTRVRTMTPADFEDLIIRLLLGMGYGQGLEEMGKALGGSGDGGVDGVIHEDPLGLERVYIQAKRYKEGSNIASGDVRNFIGALNIQRATKGVFVTASSFTPDARRAAQDATVQIVLIDAPHLAELMVRYKVGVLVRAVVEIKEADEGFFDR